MRTLRADGTVDPSRTGRRADGATPAAEEGEGEDDEGRISEIDVFGEEAAATAAPAAACAESES
jgi:hypothetical protein